MEEREQFFERVFRLAILEEAFHVEDTKEGFRLGLGELSCGAEELGLLPCPGGGLFRFFGGRLLPLALSEQGRFHRIEGFKETFLPCCRLFAGEAHRKEGEAVAGETVGGAYFSFSVLVPNGRKIALVELWRAFHVVYSPQYILMLLLERLSYDEGRGSRNAAFGLDHVLWWARRLPERCSVHFPSCSSFGSVSGAAVSFSFVRLSLSFRFFISLFTSFSAFEPQSMTMAALWQGRMTSESRT